MPTYIQICRHHTIYPGDGFCRGEPGTYCIRRCESKDHGCQCIFSNGHDLGQYVDSHFYVRPSDINLHGYIPPLINTLGKPEAEAAASIIVAILQTNGNKWAPISQESIEKFVKYHEDNNIRPWCQLFRNPFWNPVFTELKTRGFAIYHHDTKEWELNQLAIDRMYAKWPKERKVNHENN